MEDVRQTALGYYMAAPEEIKEVVRHFYEEMDPNSANNHVKFKEFSKYMETIGRGHMASDEFFEELKQPGNDVLYCDDVLTLFYIIYSGRPFCGGPCKKFVKGMYFTCMECFGDRTIDSPFSVCSQCFAAGKYEHCHDDFLDLSAHLQCMRMKVLSNGRGSNLDEEGSTSTDGAGKRKTSSTASTKSENGTDQKPKYQRSSASVTTVLKDPSTSSSSSSQSDKPAETNNSLSSAIVPAVKQQSKQATMQTAIQLGQLLASIGGIVVASSCTIL